jgi:CRISPR-associated protein Cmr2
MEENVKELFLAKIGALLHDPPDKAWLLKEHKRHEERTEELAKKILGDKLYGQLREKRVGEIIHCSDFMDASIDRWLTSVAGFGAREFPNETVCLLNILSGGCYYLKERPREEDIDEFARELGRLLSEAGDDLAVKYHLLYGLLEPLFYEYCPGATSPADTRLPTHSIFDHLYATASTVNWMLKSKGGTPSGLLVRVDLGGIQEFISSSRKLSDFWVSSWLVSFIAWKTIEKIVEVVGPDVLIMPTARNNVFYYHLLLRKLKDARIKDDFYSKVVEIAKKYANYDKEFGMPKHPIIPATIDLILPPLDILSSLLKEDIKSTEDLANYFLKIYLGVWKGLIEKIEEAASSNGAQEELLADAFTKLKDQGVDGQPPLLLRVITVSVPDEVKEGIKGEDGDSRYKIYDEAFNLLLSKALQLGMFKASPLAAIEITSWTEEAWRGRQRYSICSVCGRLPSVLDVSYEDDRYQKQVLGGLTVYFDQGEKLCGYCLVKRLMSIPSVFKVVAKEIVHCLGKPSAMAFPSTGDIASIGFKQKVLDAAKKANPEELKELCQLIKDYLKEPRHLPPTTLAYKRLAELTAEAQGLHVLKDDEARNLLVFFLQSQGEKLYLRYEEEAERRREQDEFRRGLQKIVKDVLHEEAPIGIYYAILRADADSLGKLLSGNIDEALFPSPGGSPSPRMYAEVLRRSLEDERCIENRELRSLYSKAFEGDKDGITKILLDEKVPNAEGCASALVELFNMIKNDGKLFVSPTYHATLSRCLMITAIKDVSCVEEKGGVVIYAGGDDLLAVLPVETALEAIMVTRRVFSEGDVGFVKGFYRLGGGIFPSAGLASRSFSVTFGHYMFPMSALLNDSYKVLEEVAKRIERLEPKPQLKKDTAVIKFIARGRGAKVEGVVPLRKTDVGNYATLLEYSKAIISKVDKGIFSTSLYYDLAREFVGREGWRRLKSFLQYPDILRCIISSIVSRNIGPKVEERVKEREVEDITSWLDESSRIIIKYPSEEGEVVSFGIQNVISAIIAYHSAVKGRE